MAQVHPTLREPQPKRSQIKPPGPVLGDQPVWVPPPTSRLADIAGRVRYFGFGIVIAALLAVLPIALLLAPSTETAQLDEDAIAAYLTAGQETPGPSASIASTRPSASGTSGIRFTIDSTPGGASVRVDNQTVGVTPLIGHRLKAGVYVLSIRKDGYAPLDTVLFVDEQANNSVLSLSLRPAGWARSEASASAARPRVNPAAPPRVNGARQQVGEPAVRPEETDTDVAEADRLSRLERRERNERNALAGESEEPAEPAASTGTLTVLVRPWGSIYIDGTLRQRESDIQYSATLPVGSHHLRIEHPTLGMREREVHIDAGQSVNLVFDLLPRD